jgi:hypothetical protein
MTTKMRREWMLINWRARGARWDGSSLLLLNQQFRWLISSHGALESSLSGIIKILLF